MSGAAHKPVIAPPTTGGSRRRYLDLRKWCDWHLSDWSEDTRRTETVRQKDEYGNYRPIEHVYTRELGTGRHRIYNWMPDYMRHPKHQVMCPKRRRVFDIVKNRPGPRWQGGQAWDEMLDAIQVAMRPLSCAEAREMQELHESNMRDAGFEPGLREKRFQ